LGEVRVVKLVDDNGREYSKQTYDVVLLSTTEKILNRELTEEEILDKLDGYFESLWKEKISHDKSKTLLMALQNVKHDFLYENLKLTEDQPYRRDVFVIFDDEAERVLGAFKDLLEQIRENRTTLWKAKQQFDMLKTNFYNYVINIALSKDSVLDPDNTLKIRVAKTHYNREVGHP